jgi:hypothetical protein
LKWQQRKFKKKQKNGKPMHGVMICDVIPSKNTKHGRSMFHIKTLHKKWHQGGLHLAFFPIELGLCKFYCKILNLDPIFGSDVHISIDYNFITRVFLVATKKIDFPFY